MVKRVKLNPVYNIGACSAIKWSRSIALHEIRPPTAIFLALSLRPLTCWAKMMNSTFLNSTCNAGPIKFDCVGITFTAAGLADCSFPCLRPSSSVRLRRRSYKIRASDAEYETAVVAGNMPEASQDERGIMCEPCGGRGWLVCDFCKGQKTNVKAENRRIYRRCPSCRAVGYILCSKCKVFKCVTFPDASDGVDLVL